MDYIRVLGEYINKKEGRKINFKEIKSHPFYKGNLFSFGSNDYVISSKKDEIIRILENMSGKKMEDYPPKFAKKYTHRKFLKAKEKRPEEMAFENKKYYIVLL